MHIFEPRYKELVGECVADEREFGLLLEDESGRREVGTRAAVLEVLQIFDDGRMNVVVEGRERFRLVEETGGRSFVTAEVEPVEDESDEPAADEEVERTLDLFRRLAEVTEADVDEPDLAAPALSFELAGRVDFGTELKQELLELRSERARLLRLAELLDRAVQAVTLEREVRDRASGNGKVSPR